MCHCDLGVERFRPLVKSLKRPSVSSGLLHFEGVEEMRKRSIGFLLCLAAVLTSLPGCGGGGEDIPKLVPLTGVLTSKGKPLPGTMISFIPDHQQKGTGGFAATDAEGKFVVKHRSGQEGIEPARYRVLLSRMLKKDGSAVPSGENAMDHGATESMPAKYLSVDTTPILLEIKETNEPLIMDLK